MEDSPQEQSDMLDRKDISLDKPSGCLRGQQGLCPGTGEVRTLVLAGQAQGLEEEEAEG